MYVSICILVLIVIMGSAITFAYFQRQEQQQNPNLISTLTCLEITMVEHTDSINLAAAFPLTDEQGQATDPFNFTITNECDTFTEFMVIASIVSSNNNVPDEYIKVALDGSAMISPTIINHLEIVNNPAGMSGISRSFLLAEGLFRQAGQSASYSFRMWLDGEDTNSPIWTDESLRNQNVSVRITVVGVARRDNTLAGQILARNQLRDDINFNTNQEGLFNVPDDYGTSHVFRGSHNLQNNVIFGGHQWKVLRIDGNGNIRLLYNGVCPNNDCIINGSNSNHDRVTIAHVPFQSGTSQINNRHVGYMFGSETGTFEEQHENTHDSNVKRVVDEFYNNLSEDIRNQIITTTFCADRSIASESIHETWFAFSGFAIPQGDGLGRTPTVYGFADRLRNRTPILTCPQSNDQLQLPIGIMTADEVTMTGSFITFNAQGVSLSFVHTMTPNSFTDGNNGAPSNNGNRGAFTFVANANSNGFRNNHPTGQNAFVRPVITIDGASIVTGTGSIGNPFIVE